jgi:opacity protein-like surface antigen
MQKRLSYGALFRFICPIKAIYTALAAVSIITPLVADEIAPVTTHLPAPQIYLSPELKADDSLIRFLIPPRISSRLDLIESPYAVELRVASLDFDDSHLRKIYSGQKTEFSVEASKKVAEGYEGWLGAGWSKKKGQSEGMHDSTTISHLPLSTGIKFMMPYSERMSTYVGAGITMTQLKIHNESPVESNRVKKWHLGSVLKLGIKYRLNTRVYLSAFTDYSIQKFNTKGSDTNLTYHEVNTRGLKIGLGLGIYL